MYKIIFTVIFTYFFAKFMNIILSEEYSGFSKKAIVTYAVKPKEGVLACATEEIYKNIQNLYLKNDLKAIQSEINNKNCILLKNGEILEGYEGTCNVVDKNSVKLFKSKKVFLQKIFVPCFAVEMQKLVEKPNDKTDAEDENKDKKSESQNSIEPQNSKQELKAPEVENKGTDPQNNNQQNIDLPKN